MLNKQVLKMLNRKVLYPMSFLINLLNNKVDSFIHGRTTKFINNRLEE